ncbi:unnamed protein product [Bemisia tabaci]|uniref:Structural maintenance of chromosomes protein n=1 Tax=Bemisia tabaci TaxID=7038 RepID=A0A9P0A9B4_BEMTA|nr:unnamed protein product [Bemisia tabaci]
MSKRKENSEKLPGESSSSKAKKPKLPEPDPESESGSENEDWQDDEDGGIRVAGIYIPPPIKPACTSENTGEARLIITHIVNENFKSYAGKEVLGPFHKSFTCIIGPNGSGKSNVIDSMLFVFGYRASKIRSKKISVLLHKSEKHRDIKSCTVQVHFQLIIDKDGEEYEVVPNSKVVIGRTAFADNSSFYTLNDKRVQFKEVAKVLARHGIDLIHNRFLILQGEVEQIAMMKPKGLTPHETGMLEYLEDIIGTTRYKTPIQKLEEQAEILNTEKTEKQNRLQLVEKERDALEEPMREAIKFLETENEVNLLRNKHWQKYIYLHKKDIEKLEAEKAEIEEGMSELKKKLKELEDSTKETTDSIKAKEKELAAMREQFEAKDQKFKQYSLQDTTIAADLKETNKKRKKLMEDKKKEENKLAELKALPEKNAKEIAELQALATRLEADRVKEEAQRDKILASLRTDTKSLQDDKDKLQAKQIDLKKTADDAKAKCDLAQSEYDIYLSTERKEKAKMEQLTASLETTEASLKEKQRQINEIKGTLPKDEETLKTAESQLSELRPQETSVQAELRTKRNEVDEKRSTMQANRSRNRVLDFILQLKAEGRVSGIFGRLGDLGAIDEKYDVAVSTACGALDNIIVDTIENVNHCIQALKQQNVGRATFIALEKMEHLRPKTKQKVKTPENVPRLFDLMKIPDERMKTAFYFGVGETLVANNLDQASRIAYESGVRHRVVTLKGEIIEPTGTMSGGGNYVMKGRMGSSVKDLEVSSPGEMKKLESVVEKLEQKFQTIRQQLHALEETQSYLSPRIKANKTNLNKYNMEYEMLSKQVPLLKEQISKQKDVIEEVKADPKQVKQLESVVQKAKKEFEKANEAAKEIENEVKEVHSKIMELTEGKMKTANKKLDEVVKKLDKTNSHVNQLSVGIKTAERNAKKAEDRIDNLTHEIEEAQNAMLKMSEEKKKMEAEVTQLLEETEAISRNIVEKEDEVKEAQKGLASVSKNSNELKAAKLKEDQKVETVNAKIKAVRDKIPHLQNNLKKLSLHEIPDVSIKKQAKPTSPQSNNEEKDKETEEESAEKEEKEKDEEEKEEQEPEKENELRTYTEEELEAFSVDDIQYRLTHLDSELEKMKPNLTVIDDYKKKTELYLKRAGELDEINARCAEIRKWHEDVRKRRLTEFMAGYSIITEKLKEMYQMITLGGDAELELCDSLDPFSEGISFSVRPPKKSWKNISNLSGGEKTLSSLALVFALHYYKPTPLYVMDEIDAALDFKNVSIVGHYIKERTKNAQFIIISLRSNMFELADTLVGIYKTYNCTKSVAINPKFYSGSLPTQPLPASQVAI